MKGPLELDLYGGCKGEIQKDFGYDVGLLQYAYVGNKLADVGGGVFKNANTTEIYGALSYGPVTGKLSYALTNLFGNYGFATNEKSSGSWYFDLSGSFDLARPGFSVVPHVGYQKVAKIDNASCSDYSLTLTRTWAPGFSVMARSSAPTPTSCSTPPGERQVPRQDLRLRVGEVRVLNPPTGTTMKMVTAIVKALQARRSA